MHIYTGEPEKAIPCIERAMRLDPAFQQQYLHSLATARFVMGDYRSAAELFRDRISVNPTSDVSRAFVASALGYLGQSDVARQIWRELKEINSDYSPADHIGRLPFRDPGEAEKFIDGLRKAGLAQQRAAQRRRDGIISRSVLRQARRGVVAVQGGGFWVKSAPVCVAPGARRYRGVK